MKLEIFLKSQLEALWIADRASYNINPAMLPPLCLRCGKPLHHEPGENALSRYADIWICSDCGKDEAIRCYASKPISFQSWNAVTSGRIAVCPDPDIAYLKDTCVFQHIYKETKTIPLCSTPRPVSEVVYSRSDYDGSKWWTTWQQCQETRIKKRLAQEVDAFHDALFALQEMKNLSSMYALKKYAEPTEDTNEFNLYSETEHFYIWLRFILREKDYNAYCHYYIK